MTALVLWTFLRLLTTTALNPGYIERGDSYALEAKDEGRDPETAKNPSRRKAFPPPQLNDILSKDIFICEPDGTPKWCPTCRIWRPDRSRHCREKDRCILKLDHFCPWVGGVTSEQSMKFFIQFNTYTVLYTIFDWILATVCIVKANRADADTDGHWVAIIVLGVFFMGLTGGIGFSAWANAITNHTTPENVAEAGGNRWRLALRIPNDATPAAGVRVVSYPSLLDCDLDELKAHMKEKSSSSEAASTSEDSEPNKEGAPPSLGPSFAIVESDCFSNPWDLGKFGNWCQIMGHNFWDWFLPLWTGAPWFSFRTYGRDDNQYKSFFPTGLAVEIMRMRAGLETPDEEKMRRYEDKRKSKFPYLLGGAGAPLVCGPFRRKLLVCCG